MPRARGNWSRNLGVTATLAGACLLLALGTTRSGQGDDGGEVSSCKGAPPTAEETLYDTECGAASTIPCGDWCCPSSAYTCCDGEEDAPPECCPTQASACYDGGGGLTGWPRYNGCSPRPDGCGGDKPQFCEGSRRNTCCPSDTTCDSSFGVAFCKDDSCPSDRRCNDGRLCCTESGICKTFLNTGYCDEDCAAQGKQKCELIGDYYGEDALHICCPSGTCKHHPDGWPFCEGVID